MTNKIDEFLIAVQSGTTFHYAFIKIDEDRSGYDNDFYFNVIKNSFPTRETVNIMISQYRKESEKTLYTAKSKDEIKEVMQKRTDLLFGMIYEEEWSLL